MRAAKIIHETGREFEFERKDGTPYYKVGVFTVVDEDGETLDVFSNRRAAQEFRDEYNSK